MSILFAALLAGGLLNRFAAIVLGLNRPQMLLYDALIFMLVSSMGAMMVHRALWLCFLGDAVVFICGCIWNQHMLVFELAMVLWNWVIVLSVFRQIKDKGDDELLTLGLSDYEKPVRR